jgi:hypothetical protein
MKLVYLPIAIPLVPMVASSPSGCHRVLLGRSGKVMMTAAGLGATARKRRTIGVTGGIILQMPESKTGICKEG